MSKRNGNYHIIVNCKGLLRKGSQCLCEQYSGYGQGGPCDDYCAGSAESVHCSQSQFDKGILDLSTENFVKIYVREGRLIGLVNGLAVVFPQYHGCQSMIF